MKLQGVGGTPTLSALNRDLIVDKQTRLARTILNGFTAYFAEFENITLAARTRFELAEWGIMQEISTRRIDLYKEKVLETLAYVNVIADDRISDFVFWTETRAVYVELVRGMTNFEIAETFYNSIYNSVFGHHRIRNEHAFVFSPQGDMPPVDVRRVVKRFSGDLHDSVATLLSQYAMHIPYENIDFKLAHESALMANIYNDISKLENEISSIKSSEENLKNQISNLNTDLTSKQSIIDGKNKSLTDLQKNLDPINSKISELETKKNDLNNNIQNQINLISQNTKKSEEVKGLVFYDDTQGTSGNRAPLLEDDITMSKKNLRPGSYLSNLDEPELNRSFQGRETLQNSTLRSIDLWDLSIEPFEYRGVKNKWVPNIQQENNSIVNVTSKYADIFPKNYPKITDYMPILSYDLDLKTITSKQLDLFGGSSISVPDTIRYTSQLSVQIVDDENKRWRRWFQTYSENLYDERTTSVAPYKNSSLLITLYQYRQDFKILSHNQYICTLNNYQMISSGASSASTDVLDVELSIVGKVDLPEIYSYLEIV